MNCILVPGVSCYDVEFKHVVVSSALKNTVESRGPRPINNSQMVS